MENQSTFKYYIGIYIDKVETHLKHQEPKTSLYYCYFTILDVEHYEHSLKTNKNHTYEKFCFPLDYKIPEDFNMGLWYSKFNRHLTQQINKTINQKRLSRCSEQLTDIIFFHILEKHEKYFQSKELSTEKNKIRLEKGIRIILSQYLTNKNFLREGYKLQYLEDVINDKIKEKMTSLTEKIDEIIQNLFERNLPNEDSFIDNLFIGLRPIIFDFINTVSDDSKKHLEEFHFLDDYLKREILFCTTTTHTINIDILSYLCYKEANVVFFDNKVSINNSLQAEIKGFEKRLTPISLKNLIQLVLDKNFSTLPIDGIIKLGVNKIEKFNFQEISDLIEKSSNISANIIKLANSTYFSKVGNRVETVKEAIRLLGVKATYYFIFSSTIISKTPSYHKYAYHSIDTANISLSIADYFIAKFPNELDHQSKLSFKSVTFSAALLHDIGKAIFSTFFATLYNEILEEYGYRALNNNFNFYSQFDVLIKQLGEWKNNPKNRDKNLIPKLAELYSKTINISTESFDFEPEFFRFKFLLFKEHKEIESNKYKDNEAILKIYHLLLNQFTESFSFLHHEIIGDNTLIENQLPKKNDILQFEEYKLKFTHTEAGYQLAKSWKFPAVLQAVIYCHHDLNQLDQFELDKEEKLIVIIVAVANQLSYAKNFIPLNHKTLTEYIDMDLIENIKKISISDNLITQLANLFSQNNSQDNSQNNSQLMNKIIENKNSLNP